MQEKDKEHSEHVNGRPCQSWPYRTTDLGPEESVAVPARRQCLETLGGAQQHVGSALK